MDDYNALITEYNIREGAPYLSPAVQIRSPKGWSGVPFWMHGVPLQTCEVIKFESPDPYARNQNFRHVEAWQASDYIGTGSAPTLGIYTGVE